MLTVSALDFDVLSGNKIVNRGCLVKLTRIENNTLNLAIEYGTLSDQTAMLALLQAWRNMPSGVHFEHLAVSEAEAKALHENATYYEDLDHVSRIAWCHARFVSREQYERRLPGPYGTHESIRLIKLAGPRGGTHYAVQKGGNATSVRGLADSQILDIVKTGSSSSFNEHQITFRDAKFFDFVRVGMVWRSHTFGDLCPRCFCVESQVEIEAKSDFIKDFQDARNLFGSNIHTLIYQCSACEAKWEQTSYSWYADFTY